MSTETIPDWIVFDDTQETLTVTNVPRFSTKTEFTLALRVMWDGTKAFDTYVVVVAEP